MFKKSTIGTLLASASFLALAYPATVFAAPMLAVDQQNSVFNAIVVNGGLGQSFTPTFVGLDSVELKTGDLKELINETIDIRQGDGFAGPIIATSNPLTGSFVPFSTLHFDFPTTVTLIPGSVYTIATSLNWMLHHMDDVYVGGRLWVNGVGGFSPGADLVFVEGLHSVPEPTTLALLGIGLAGLAVTCRRRQHDKFLVRGQRR